MMKRAAIYARISKADKKVPKVENQIATCQAIAADEGWTVDPAHIFADDGIAASGRAIDDTTLENRPGARSLLALLRSGEVDALIAVEGERLARTYLDGLEFIKASSAGRVIWYLDTDGLLDPSTPAGEETAVSIFASGRREGRIRGQRQARRYNAERAAGRPTWGLRPYGWEADRITVRESEAVHVREAVRAVLEDGMSMTKLAHTWNAAGIKTDGMLRERMGRDGIKKMPRGYWTATTIRQLLLRPRNAGHLVHKGAVLPNSQIQPLITEAEFEALQSRIKVGTPVGARATSFLGGIVRCECGAPMHATDSYSQRKGGPRNVYRIYKCSETTFDKTRRHASIQTKFVDEKAALAALVAIATGALREDDTPEYNERLTEIAVRLTELNAQEARAEDALIEGLGDPKRVRGRLETIKAERVELHAERERLEADRAGGGALRMLEVAMELATEYGDEDTQIATMQRGGEAWNALPLEEKQAIMRGKFKIEVAVGGRGEDRVSVDRR